MPHKRGKPHGGSRAARLGSLYYAILAALGIVSLARPPWASGNYYWDPAESTNSGSFGGSGVWDTTTPNWSQGSGPTVTWSNASEDYPSDAEFTGSGGTVTLNSASNSLQVSGLYFSAPYTINGPASGNAGIVLVSQSSCGLDAAGGPVTINANLSGIVGVTESGTFNLGGNNSALIATITVNGTINLTSSNGGSAASTWTLNGGTLSYSPTSGGAGKTIALGALSGTSGTLTNSGSAGSSDLITFSIGALGSSTTFGGTITDSSSGDKTAISLIGGTLTLTGANTYSGATNVTGSTLQLQGASGSIANSSAINLLVSVTPTAQTPAALTLNDGSATNSNRLSSTVPITFNGGTLTYDGSSSFNSTQSVGPISLASGYDQIAVDYGGSNVATLSTPSLNRSVGGGTLFVSGFALGTTASPASSTSRILIGTTPALVGAGPLTTTNTPTEKNTPIIPFGVASNPTATGYYTFLTYSPSGGLRALNTSNEFSDNTFASGTNTLITSNTTATASTSINSLDVGAKVSLSSGVTLGISSGAILAISGSISGDSTTALSFNNSEAILTTIYQTSFGTPTFPLLTISTNLENLTALTINGNSAASMLSLTQNSNTTDSAPVYIQSGVLMVSKEADLGNATGNNAITFPLGSTGDLDMTGTSTTFSMSDKGIQLLGTGTLTVGYLGSSGTATLGGVISGAGNLQLGISGALTLTNPANTYTGTTSITGGTLYLSANSNNNISGSSMIVVGTSSSYSATVLDATQLTASGGFQLHSGQTLAGWGTLKPPSGGLVVSPGSTISAGDGVSQTGKLTTTGEQIWQGGGTYLWKLNLSSAGTANSFNNTKTGAGWDELTMNSLSITASSANPFNIEITAVGNTNDATFDSTKSYRWVAANMPAGQATGNLANVFALNVSGFPSLNGTFSASIDSTDDPGYTDLVISYAATPEPSALTLVAAGVGCTLLRRRRIRRTRRV